MPFGYIYKIVFPNGKHYIGLTTTSLEQRTKQHKCCAKSGNTKWLYNALRKYDMIDTLELIEIDTANTEEELCEKEIGYILNYNSYYMNGNGYNMTFGGEGTNGYVFTEEDNKKNSERKKKYFENPEAITKCSEAQKKRFENPEAIQKISEAQKKRFENPEALQKNREAQQKYHQEHPEAGKEHGEKMKNYYEDNQEARRKSSKGQHNLFDVFTKDGIFIKTFSYQFEAKEYLQKEYNITSTFNISAVLAGNRKSSAGLVFKYK